MRLRYLLVIALALAPQSLFAAGASAVPTGPKTVTVGQTFSVSIVVNNASDADTIRMNGTFSKDLLKWVGAAPKGNFLNVSPASSFNQSNGTFSFGVFSLEKTTNGTASVANMTFTALQPGTAVISLGPSSRILAEGNDQLTSQGQLSIQILPKKAAATGQESQVGLKSASHPNPDAWYSSRDVVAAWNTDALSGYRVTVGFDQAPQGPAELRVDTGSYAFRVPTDGVWYLHLKASSPSGERISQDLRIQIDATNPRKLVPVTEQDSVPSTIANSILFAALDDTSGIDHYDIFIDQAFVASTTANSFALPALGAGQHYFEVAAYDRAGNVSRGSGKVTIAPSIELTIIGKRIQLIFVYLVVLVVVVTLAVSFVWFYWGLARLKKKSTRSR